MLGAVNRFATVVWPPTGIALVALYLLGLRYWPAIALSAFLVNWLNGAPVYAALGVGLGNTLEAVAGAFFLIRVGFDRSLATLRDVFALFFFGAFLSTLLSAFIGVSSLFVAGLIQPGTYNKTWAAWWLGDAMGDLLVAPFLFVWSRTVIPRSFYILSVLEVTFLNLFVVGSSLIIFTDAFSLNKNAIFQTYMIFPVLMLVAVRLSQKWSTTALAIVSAIVIYTTSIGHGRFWTGNLSESLFRAQLFLGVVAITKLVLAATLMERKTTIAEIGRGVKSRQFLVEATRVLSESMDYQTTLKKVAEVVVPQIADMCLVHTLNEEGVLERAEIACNDREKEKILHELVQKYYSDSDGPTLLAKVIRTKQSQRVDKASNELYRSISKSEAHYKLLKKLRFSSIVAAPLIYHDRLVGVIVFGMLNDRRTLGYEEVSLLEELARRSAISVENARLYREARDAIFARDEFLSIASHELKTPLTSLSLRLQMLLYQFRMNPSQGNSGNILIPAKSIELVSKSEEQSRKLASLLDRLLDVSRIRLGALQLHRETVDVCDLIRTVIDRFRAEADHFGVEIRSQCNPETHGYWDKIRVEQIVSNLISNALKYGNMKPIFIKADRNEKNNTVRFTFKDMGIGIPASMKGKIFNRFERAEEVGHKIPGLGLGLYICRQIVLAHGGTIRVDSVEGQGSTFTVELPEDRTKAAISA